MAVAALSAAGSISASPMAPPPFELVREIGGEFTGFAVGEDRLFVGVGRRVAALTDAHGDVPPQLVGITSSLPEEIVALAALPGRAVVAGAGRSLYFFDATRPGAPVLVHRHEMAADVQVLASAGDHCYVVAGDVLHVLRITGAQTVAEVGALTLPISPSHLLVSEGLAFLGLSAVLVLDVRDPTEPVVIGALEELVAPVAMAATGKTLYVLDRGMGLNEWGREAPLGTQVHTLRVDVDRRAIEHTVTELSPPEPSAFRGMAIAAAGNDVFVRGTWERDWTWHHELRCWNFSDPQRPIATCQLDWMALGPEALVSVDGRLYQAGNSRSLAEGGFLSPVVNVADVSDGTAPMLLGSWLLGEPGHVACVATIGSDFAFHEFTGNFHFYDGSQPGNLVTVGYLTGINVAELALRMVGRPHTLHTLGSEVHAYDVADRGNAVQIAASERLIPGQVLPIMAVSEPYVLVADGALSTGPPNEPGYRLVVLRYEASGQQLVRVGELVVGAFVDDIAVDGHLACVLYRDYPDVTARLAVVDWTDPTALVVVGRFTMPEAVNPKRLLVRDGIAYVVAKATSDSGGINTALSVLDVADPSRIRVIGQANAPRVGTVYEPYARGQHYVLALVGNYALVSGHEPLLRVVDVSDRAAPVEVQTFPAAAAVSDLAANEDHAFAVFENGESYILRRKAGSSSGGGRVVYLPAVVTF